MENLDKYRTRVLADIRNSSLRMLNGTFLSVKFCVDHNFFQEFNTLLKKSLSLCIQLFIQPFLKIAMIFPKGNCSKSNAKRERCGIEDGRQDLKIFTYLNSSQKTTYVRMSINKSSKSKARVDMPEIVH
uniref:Ccr4-not transcription complex, putative n=1 Tax=Arundo donax TaxID=35708 RepID=A0A0A9DBS2_ARUDO